MPSVRDRGGCGWPTQLTARNALGLTFLVQPEQIAGGVPEGRERLAVRTDWRQRRDDLSPGGGNLLERGGDAVDRDVSQHAGLPRRRAPEHPRPADGACRVVKGA